MSKPSATREDPSSPDPFVVDASAKEEDTPTQELTQHEVQSAQASAAGTQENSVEAERPEAPHRAAGLDAKDGGASAWGGEDMPPPPPTPPPVLRRQSTSERAAQTLAVPVSLDSLQDLAYQLLITQFALTVDRRSHRS